MARTGLSPLVPAYSPRNCSEPSLLTYLDRPRLSTGLGIVNCQDFEKLTMLYS